MAFLAFLKNFLNSLALHKKRLKAQVMKNMAVTSRSAKMARAGVLGGRQISCFFLHTSVFLSVH